MPEPVVIVRGAGDPEAEAPEAQPDATPEEAAGPSAGRRIAGFALSLLRRIAKAIASVIIYLLREYPRHCLAAGASVVILGAIMYSQSGSKTGRQDLPNAISGNASLQPAVSKLPGSEPPTDVAAVPAPAPAPGTAPKSVASDQGTAIVANPAKAPEPDAKEANAPQNDLTAQTGPPAPKAESTPRDTAPTNELALTGAAEKAPGSAEPAPAPSPTSPGPTDVPLPPPTSDAAKATLMADNLAPAPVGDQAAKTKASTDVPPELWLPDNAPKTGADEATKSAKPGETAVAAAPTGENKPAGDPTKDAADAAGKPGAASGTPAGASSQVIIPPPASPAPVSQTPKDTKSDTATEGPAPLLPPPASPSPTNVVGPPIVAPLGDAAAERDKKPATPQEPASKTTDSSAPPPAPPAESPLPGSEKGKGNNVSGPGALPAPAAAPARDEPITGNSPPAEREREHTASADTVAPAPSAAAEPKVDASSPKNVPKAGWIVIPNSGKVPGDPTESAMAASGDSGALDGSEPGSAAKKLGAHTERDIAFEPEPSPSRGTREPAGESAGADGRRAAPGLGATPQPRAASHSERVEATEHLVESRENYWTISRQYYGSGRYYRALWKANEAKHPDINVLHVNDVIVVPAIQDLDPDLIQPTSAPARSDSLAAAAAPAATPSRPRNQRARQDEEAASAEQPTKGRGAANSAIYDSTVDETESRTAARPRPGGTPPGRPVYRVHAYDTLRSIARDTMGSARRADEILDLNRGLIDDPNQLVIGQVIELPEDAKTTIRRPAKR